MRQIIGRRRMIAAHAALVERESNRFSIQLQPSFTKPKYICLSISINASSIRTIPGNRLVIVNSCLDLAQPMCRGGDCLTKLSRAQVIDLVYYHGRLIDEVAAITRVPSNTKAAAVRLR